MALQVANPKSTRSANFTNSGCGAAGRTHLCVDEGVGSDDGRYIHPTSTGDICRLKLDSLSNPGTDCLHEVRIRSRKVGGGVGTFNINVQLRQESTLIEDLGTHSILAGAGYATETFAVSAASAANITNYGLLEIWLTATVVISSGTPEGRIENMDFRCPPANSSCGNVAATLAALTSDVNGEQTIEGTVGDTLAPVTAAVSGATTISGTATATLGAVTASMSGVSASEGALAATISAVTSDINGQETLPGTVAATLASLTAAITGQGTFPATVEATLAPITASFNGATTLNGNVGATLSAVTSLINGQSTVEGTLGATLPAVTSDIHGTQATSAVTGTLAATLAAVTASFTGALFQDVIIGDVQVALVRPGCGGIVQERAGEVTMGSLRAHTTAVRLTRPHAVETAVTRSSRVRLQTTKE